MVILELPALVLSLGSIAIYKSCKHLYNVAYGEYVIYKKKKQYIKISPLCEYNIFDQTQCVICFDNLQQTVRQLPCKHIFHKDCIDKWILEKKGNCPICNYVVI